MRTDALGLGVFVDLAAASRAVCVQVAKSALGKAWLGIPHSFARYQDHMGLFAEVLHADLTLPSKPHGEIRSLDLLEPMKYVHESLPENSVGRAALRLLQNCLTVAQVRKRSLSEFPHSRHVYNYNAAVIVGPNGRRLAGRHAKLRRVGEGSAGIS